VLLFELVTGTRPFEGKGVDEIFDLILHQPLARAALDQAGAPAQLSELVLELTDKDTSRRPRDFSEVVRRLDLIPA
jgi:hypothetical protein